MKTIERAHSPKNLWQKIRLKKNYAAALEQLDQHLQYWPKFLVHKNKQRFTKITQYLIRMRRLEVKARPKLVGINRKLEKVERKREAKAEAAAHLEKSIESELLKRLQSGTYGDIYNFPLAQYEKVLDTQEVQEAEEEEELGEEFVAGDEEDEEEDEEEEIEYLDDDQVELDEEDMEDWEDGPEEGDDDEEGDDEEPSGSGHGEDEEASSDEEESDDVEGGSDQEPSPPRKRKAAPPRGPQRAGKAAGKAAAARGKAGPVKRQRRQVEIEYEEERMPTRQLH
ncbi:hypothetical protein GPECTOR_14g13 [Gonium pectorale]|uniref:Protein MAK16 homolog n=1 Tax=Gonium pectorale TaxID=33097 RepID=A0A150GNG2_GONPE|nr:hypothetical protein GPECTOR_14g13 [Gonium pectorale]|eukprot:KXZ50880.1 hypothetical protein GPECTOR_14g13 [Gonium pectorale]